MDLNYENVLSLASQDADEAGGHTLYALVDHGAIADLTNRLTRFGVSWTSLFEGSRDQGALQVAPILVPLHQRGQALASRSALKWLCEQGRFTSSLLFLLSPLDTPTLARRLALRLDATLPDNLDIVLRYFDTRIFDALMTVFDGPQQAAFLSVATTWSSVGRSGRIQTYAASFQEDDGESLPIEFTTAQEKALIEFSEPDQVAMLLRSVVPAEYERIAHAVRHDFLKQHIAAARGYAITSVQEQALFCSLILTEGEHFAAAPKWQQALTDVAASRLTLFAAVNQVG